MLNDVVEVPYGPIVTFDRPRTQVSATVLSNQPYADRDHPGMSASGRVSVRTVDGGGVGLGVPNHQKLFCSSGLLPVALATALATRSADGSALGVSVLGASPPGPSVLGASLPVEPWAPVSVLRVVAPRAARALPAELPTEAVSVPESSGVASAMTGVNPAAATAASTAVPTLNFVTMPDIVGPFPRKLKNTFEASHRK